MKKLFEFLKGVLLAVLLILVLGCDTAAPKIHRQSGQRAHRTLLEQRD